MPFSPVIHLQNKSQRLLQGTCRQNRAVLRDDAFPLGRCTSSSSRSALSSSSLSLPDLSSALFMLSSMMTFTSSTSFWVFCRRLFPFSCPIKTHSLIKTKPTQPPRTLAGIMCSYYLNFLMVR